MSECGIKLQKNGKVSCDMNSDIGLHLCSKKMQTK